MTAKTNPHRHLSVCVLVQAVQPKLEAMEAAWYRLHAISGAATPDQVIAYWEGMHTLVDPPDCFGQRRWVDAAFNIIAGEMHALDLPCL